MVSASSQTRNKPSKPAFEAAALHRSGLVTMDHYGAPSYKSGGRLTSVDVYGDYLSWAIIESNFYE